MRGEQGIERRQRPVQGGARVRQLPGEPGALRGRGLRAVLTSDPLLKSSILLEPALISLTL